jgi:DNA polymerase-3 subunit epsilon
VSRSSARRAASGLLTISPKTCSRRDAAYVLYSEPDVPLYVGRSVRLRQRVRSHLCGERRKAKGERRKAKEMRLAQQICRVEWRETGGRDWRVAYRGAVDCCVAPLYNRLPRVSGSDPADAPWPFEHAIVFEEHGNGASRASIHLIDRWCYLGCMASLDEARALIAKGVARNFELSTYRIFQAQLARGLRVTQLTAACSSLKI